MTRLEIVRVVVFSVIPAFARKVEDQMNDPAHDQEHAEKDQKSGDAVDDVVHLHPAGPVEALADLDGEGQHQNDRGDVEERNDHGVAGPGEPEKDRMQNQNQGDPEAADDDKMQFLIRKTVLALIVQG